MNTSNYDHIFEDKSEEVITQRAKAIVTGWMGKLVVQVVCRKNRMGGSWLRMVRLR